MAFPAKTMLELIILITWTCLTQPVRMNNLFKQFFFDQTVLSELCSAASLYFCPGLFEVIQAAVPPPVSFFRNLPKDGSGKWAIYVVVLLKDGCIPLIYIGSGTRARGGITARFRCYNDPETYGYALSEYVRRALNNGYTIDSFGMLVWCSIPSAADVPKYRLLFVAMEAALSFLFWTMRSKGKGKDYGIGSCCPWLRDSFSYDGLCSHNPLGEGVLGNFDLSDEQLEAIATEVAERKRAARIKSDKKLRAQDPEGFVASRRETNAKFRQANPEHCREYARHRFEKAKASKKYYCNVCGLACPTQKAFDIHNASYNHKRNARRAQRGIIERWYCRVCSRPFCTKRSLTRHELSSTHLKRVAAVEASTDKSESGK